VASSAGATVSGIKALSLLKLLGIQVADINETGSYSQDSMRQLIEKSPRRVNIGNNPKQIEAAFILCQHHALAPCRRDWFSDEIIRPATLEPFDIDQTPVSVGAFRQFVEATHYRTTAENRGYAYASVQGGHLLSVEGGNWRNAIKQRTPSDDNAVVGVSFEDAQAYCRFRNERLPTENEWEYVARGGAERRTFPWGEDEGPALNQPLSQPKVGDGPPEGIGGRYRGLSGNVWQWVDSHYDKTHRILKGGSWLESSPANRRSASRRGEVSDRADDDSGFRCARSLQSWPDTDLYMAQLK
jgi:formylglycine-generating enzyme required for sulfatase activity